MTKWTLLSLAATALAAAGCAPEQIAYQKNEVPPDYLSAGELAARTNMRLVRLTHTCASFENGPNSLLLICDPGGAIFVNGKHIAKGQPVIAAENTLYVPTSIVGPVRANMLMGAPDSGNIRRTIDNGSGKTVIYIGRPPIEPPRETTAHGLVVLDPGHGGTDPGTQAFKGADEKDINLKVARLVRDKLKDRGVKVIMTRDSDVLIDLTERAEIANRNKADLFVSIHCNSANDASVSGYSIYVDHTPTAPSSKAAETVSQHLAANNSGKGVIKDPRGLRVLVKNNRPAMLIEVGYLSNAAEARLLASDQYEQKIASAIADGIVEYLKS